MAVPTDRYLRNVDPRERFDIKKPGLAYGQHREAKGSAVQIGFSFDQVMGMGSFGGDSRGSKITRTGIRSILRSSKARKFFTEFWRRVGVDIRRAAAPLAPAQTGDHARTSDQPSDTPPTARSGLLRRIGSMSIRAYPTGVKVRAGPPGRKRKGTWRQQAAGRYSHLRAAGVKYAGPGRPAARIPEDRWLYTAQRQVRSRTERAYLRQVERQVQAAMDSGARTRGEIAAWFDGGGFTGRQL